MLNLPRSHLSYSAIDLWTKSKDQFRKRYYLNERPPETPEMLFGKKMANLLEKDDPMVRKIPRYFCPEYKLEVMIGDVPMLGYIDSFDPLAFRFYEYKTGRAKTDGKPRWDRVAVHETDQLVMYSLLLQEKYGKVENLCHLVWLETHFVEKIHTTEFDGKTLEASKREIDLKGHMEVFPRTIKQYERDDLRKKIIRVANEISDDYTKFKRERDSKAAL